MALRAFSFGAVGLVLALLYGAQAHTIRLGLACGLLIASGLALGVGVERRQRGALAPPPLSAVLGAVLLGLGIAALVAPHAIFLPRWLVPLEVVFNDGARRVLAGERGREAAQALAEALPIYDRAFTSWLGPGVERCAVDFVIADDDETLGALERGARSRGEFGFFHAPLVGRPVVVVRPGSGWGGVTHHWMYALAPCRLGAQPPWVPIGLATLAEKHAPVDGVLSFRFRSDWRVPDSVQRTAPRDLALELREANDQGFLRSFFLYLLDRGALPELLAALRAGVPAHEAVARLRVEPSWHAWHGGDAHAIPMLPGARPRDDAPQL
ncbi:MAG: hypothetical protein IT383_24275 [Deltaproteobacteria bacterium]|nr:hypothetical protein [Deltaproteobacteria bacterium]